MRPVRLISSTKERDSPEFGFVLSNHPNTPPRIHNIYNEETSNEGSRKPGAAMKAKKALKRLTRIEKMLSGVLKGFSAVEAQAREFLDSAKSSIGHAKDAMTPKPSPASKKTPKAKPVEAPAVKKTASKKAEPKKAAPKKAVPKKPAPKKVAAAKPAPAIAKKSTKAKESKPSSPPARKKATVPKKKSSPAPKPVHHTAPAVSEGIEPPSHEPLLGETLAERHETHEAPVHEHSDHGDSHSHE
jgi:hypothetical protein